MKPDVICDRLVGPAMGARMREMGFRDLVFLTQQGNGGAELGTPYPPRKRSPRLIQCPRCEGRGVVPEPRGKAYTVVSRRKGQSP